MNGAFCRALQCYETERQTSWLTKCYFSGLCLIFFRIFFIFHLYRISACFFRNFSIELVMLWFWCCCFFFHCFCFIAWGFYSNLIFSFGNLFNFFSFSCILPLKGLQRLVRFCFSLVGFLSFFNSAERFRNISCEHWVCLP